MLLYYITDRAQLALDEPTRRQLLIERIAAAARAGVDFIQLREKDLSGGELEELALAAVAAVQGTQSKLLINSRVDITVATGAHGVHLRAEDISPADARAIFAKCGVQTPIIGASCHTSEEVAMAVRQQADFVVFGPVFEKYKGPGIGVGRLREACRAAGKTRVLALGGITTANAEECMQAGAAGVAGIRLFQAGGIKQVVSSLRVRP